MSKPKRDGAMKTTRRQFAKSLAAVAATPLALPTVAPARQEPTPARPRPPQTPPAEPPSPVAEALTEVVRKRYPNFLNEDQIGEVRKSIDRGLRSAERMRLFDLKNGDEPAFIFTTQVQ